MKGQHSKCSLPTYVLGGLSQKVLQKVRGREVKKHTHQRKNVGILFENNVGNQPGMVLKSELFWPLEQACHMGNTVDDAPVLNLESVLLRIKVHILFVCVFLTRTVKGTRGLTQTAQFFLNGLMLKNPKGDMVSI